MCDRKKCQKWKTFVLRSSEKGIGIRRVLGAQLSHVYRSVAESFFLIIVMSGCLAAFTTYAFYRYWVTGFVVKTKFQIGFILFPLAFILLTTLILTLFQVVAATRQNPVKSLSEE